LAREPMRRSNLDWLAGTAGCSDLDAPPARAPQRGRSTRGGRPVIALPSTARDGAVSRIVPVLSQGTGVVTSRGDVHWVVTEWGVADLFARGVHERAQALIDIAHPDFRDELRREATARHLLRS
jgi:acyl-CoA hydrolase